MENEYISVVFVQQQCIETGVARVQMGEKRGKLREQLKRKPYTNINNTYQLTRFTPLIPLRVHIRDQKQATPSIRNPVHINCWSICTIRAVCWLYQRWLITISPSCRPTPKIIRGALLDEMFTPLVSSTDEISPPGEHLENKTDARFVLYLVNSN